MSVRVRIAALVLAAAFLAVPSVSLAAEAFGTCCCGPAICPDAEADCGEALARAACCAEAPPVLPSGPQASAKTNSPQVLATAHTTPRAEAPIAVLEQRASLLAPLTSPLRRSVVLRI